MTLEQRKPRRTPGPDHDQDPDIAPVTMDSHREDLVLATIFGGLALGCGGVALLLWTVPVGGAAPAPATLSLSLATLARVLGTAVTLVLSLAFTALAVLGGAVYAVSERDTA